MRAITDRLLAVRPRDAFSVDLKQQAQGMQGKLIRLTIKTVAFRSLCDHTLAKALMPPYCSNDVGLAPIPARLLQRGTHEPSEASHLPGDPGHLDLRVVSCLRSGAESAIYLENTAWRVTATIPSVNSVQSVSSTKSISPVNSVNPVQFLRSAIARSSLSPDCSVRSI